MSTNNHRGPVKGYNSREKQAYRKAVWASMKDAIKIANESADGYPYYILMLPGLSAKEVDTAIRFGLRKDRIILVHESEQHVNTEAEWRTKYPEIKYYTGILSGLFDKFKEDKIKFSGANLDFCGNFSSETIDEYSAFCDYYSKNQSDNIPLTVGVTVTKGRETPSMVRLLEKLHTRNEPVGLSEKRLEVLVREFGCEIKEHHVSYLGVTKSKINVLVEGAYVHNKAPMAYCVVEYVHPNAFSSNIMNACSQEAEKVFKKFIKIAPRKLPDFNSIDSLEEFEAYKNKRDELVSVAEPLLSPDWRDCEYKNLRQYYSITGGSRTKVKTLAKRFLNKDQLQKFETTLAKYYVYCSTSLDFSLSTHMRKEPIDMPYRLKGKLGL